MSKPTKICSMCGNKITAAMTPYGINTGNETKPCCGRCFALIRINDQLMGVLKDGNNRRSRLQVPNGDVH